MSLTAGQFARAQALEARQLRLSRMLRMTPRELEVLLTGDPAEAAEWVLSAAEHGIAAAQLRLGRMLLEGTGVARDERAALAWFSRAAGGGNAEAMNMVGRCHENGWGTPADFALAVSHYRASARGRHDWGEYNFGNMLFDGRGIARDLPLALYWYLRAARQGHGRAMNLLGRCLEEGWGCSRSLDDAAYWYRRSAESGYFRGQLNHALMLVQHGFEAAAADWFWKAAEGGNDEIRRSIAGVLAAATEPALMQVGARVRAMIRAPHLGDTP
jgi:uncharacterized protein